LVADRTARHGRRPEAPRGPARNAAAVD